MIQLGATRRIGTYCNSLNLDSFTGQTTVNTKSYLSKAMSAALTKALTATLLLLLCRICHSLDRTELANENDSLTAINQKWKTKKANNRRGLLGGSSRKGGKGKGGYLQGGFQSFSDYGDEMNGSHADHVSADASDDGNGVLSLYPGYYSGGGLSWIHKGGFPITCTSIPGQGTAGFNNANKGMKSKSKEKGNLGQGYYNSSSGKYNYYESIKSNTKSGRGGGKGKGGGACV